MTARELAMQSLHNGVLLLKDRIRVVRAETDPAATSRTLRSIQRIADAIKREARAIDKADIDAAKFINKSTRR